MRLLSDEELASLRPSETATFPGPIPTQSVSSDEFMPAPQTANQRRVESRIAAMKKQYEQDGSARSNLRHGYVVPARG